MRRNEKSHGKVDPEFHYNLMTREDFFRTSFPNEIRSQFFVIKIIAISCVSCSPQLQTFSRFLANEIFHFLLETFFCGLMNEVGILRVSI